MAFSITTTQKGDSITSILLCAHNPLFWIFDVTDAAADFVIGVQVTVGSDTYQFDAVPQTFDGVNGTFIFYGWQIFNALLNAPDDIVPTGDIALATEMFKNIQIEAAWDTPGPSGEIFYDETLSFVNSVHDVGNENGATMLDWENLDIHNFFSQKDKDTYWYFYNKNIGTKFLEYSKVDSIPNPADYFVTQWTVPAASFTFPAGNTGTYDGEINFGDGTGWKTFSSYNDPNLTNVYSVGGTYQIQIKGKFPWLHVNNGVVSTYLDKVTQWGDIDFQSFTAMFYGCINLTEIPPSLSGNVNINSAIDMFRSCSSLVGGIPDFSYFVNITSFQRTFISCVGLTGSIPSFASNPLVTTFQNAFTGCTGLTGTIPSFASNPLVTTFGSTFASCTGLTGSIPSFASNTLVTAFNATFNGCIGLTGILSSFAANTLVTTFANCFEGCTSLTSAIPYSIFSGCTAVTSFNRTFYNCRNMTGGIPDFSNCTLVTTFNQTFNFCVLLNGNISDFSNCINVIAFTSTFGGCSLLVGASNTLWLKGDNNLVGPDYNIGTPDGDSCYAGGTLLTDYATIPVYWK